MLKMHRADSADELGKVINAKCVNFVIFSAKWAKSDRHLCQNFLSSMESLGIYNSVGCDVGRDEESLDFVIDVSYDCMNKSRWDNKIFTAVRSQTGSETKSTTSSCLL